MAQEHAPGGPPLADSLQAVVLRSPYQVATFVHGTSVLRQALASFDSKETLTIAPLRGAMPMVWTASGLAEYEPVPNGSFIEVPIGTFQYQGEKGTRETSPREDQKRFIMRRSMQDALAVRNLDPETTRVAIVDEVQKGGTLGTAARITRSLMTELELSPELRVMAVQDSRPRMLAQKKTEAYKILASNSLDRTHTTVIPVPLIATDRTALLDTIYFTGSDRRALTLGDHLSVVRNVRAESMFRTLGSLARSSELRHDPDTIDGLLNAHGELNIKAANRVEVWVETLVQLFDRLANNERQGLTG